MTIRTKLPLYSSLILFLSITLVSVFLYLNFRSYVVNSIRDYRQEQTQLILNHLKDIVNIAYRMIDQSYKVSQEEIRKDYGFAKLDTIPEDVAKMIRINLLKITISQLRTLRFGKEGYLWINEFDPPYKVIMHGARPELEGKSWVFFIPGTDINVYKAFHDSIIAGGGAARVSYSFYKPDTKKFVPKISWVRLYKPLRWVIGTGVYIDEIDRMVDAKNAQLRERLRSMLQFTLLLMLLMEVLSIAILYLFARSITAPLLKIKDLLGNMALGKIVEAPHIERKDEIGEMSESLIRLIEGLKHYAKFAEEIGKGNFNVEFELLSDDDVLGKELLLMRNRLLEARKREQEQLEIDKKRHWVSTGISMFSDLITSHKGDIEELVDKVLAKLLEYVNAEVGGVFLVEFDEENPEARPHLRLVASYAFNHKKKTKKVLEINEGLVGACVTEREPIYVSDIPDNYIEIRSGFIKGKPKFLYLSPIKYEQKSFGAIELASFEDFDEYKREIIDQVAQSLAVALSTHKYYLDKNLNVDDWF